LLAFLAVLCSTSSVRAAAVSGGTFSDDFSVSHDYLASGVTGTIWDGVYTGTGSFPGEYGPGPASTLIADANVTGAGRLTVQSVNSSWMGVYDNGFFLFKNVSGDFQVSVHVVTPFDTTPFNQAGLMVRAAGPNGAPWNGAENSVSLNRFDAFGISNLIRNNTNGQAQETPLYVANDPNYWLRIDRVNGTTFNFYQKALASDPWQLIGTTVERPDFAGLTLQVGIDQDSQTPSPTQAQFESFSLVLIPEPGVATLICGGLAVAGVTLRKRRRLE
jgi:regulation of enolase protein 1 (concanavalin A-like superfamily)